MTTDSLTAGAVLSGAAVRFFVAANWSKSRIFYWTKNGVKRRFKHILTAHFVLFNIFQIANILIFKRLMFRVLFVPFGMHYTLSPLY